MNGERDSSSSDVRPLQERIAAMFMSNLEITIFYAGMPVMWRGHSESNESS